MNRVEAAARAEWERSGPTWPGGTWETEHSNYREYLLECSTATLTAADDVMFSPASIAEIVRTTGLSIQTVTEVVRALKGAGG